MAYGLLGEKLSHSYSPLIHSMLAHYGYSLIEVAPDELDAFMTTRDFDGLNVTIPYKKAVIPYLSEMSDRARKIGSVNTVVRRQDGSLYGDNTDYGGFMSLVKKSGIRIRGKKVLVLGSGGASVAVIAVLSDMKAGKIVTISRSGEDNYDNLEKHADADVIVNTTPVGMYPHGGEMPLDPALFPKCAGVIDIIYNPSKTALVLRAEQLGIPSAGGLHMLVAQAAIASGVFLSKKPDMAEVDKIEKTISSMMKNIVLIGMPGCGKTSVGKRLAKILGREFIDVDAQIVKKAGKSIPEIFADGGEDEFRRMETACTAEACARSGCVISTGGGVVTRDENRDLLRQNGTIVFIIRDLDRLSSRGRPLSATRSAQQLWEERGEKYKSWSDVKVLNTGVSNTARELIRFLGLKPSKPKKERHNNANTDN